MYIVCSDLEGVFVPEIWINVAEQTGIDELKLTTRDISDYNVLMKRRLDLLNSNGLTLENIRSVISRLQPLPGAVEFVSWLRSKLQLIVVSDTFVEFADPLMEKLGRPTLFCHNLTTDKNGMITSYNLRQEDAKRKTVCALRDLNYKIIAIGDSYNDIAMLREADQGILFRPPQNVVNEHPGLTRTDTYDELKSIISRSITNE